jgi:outer membrane protein
MNKPPLKASLLALALVLPCWAGAQVFSGSLLDAVTLTLRQDASIASGRLQVAASRGQLLSARAPFDTLWTAGMSQQQSFTPLPASGGAVLDSSQLTYQTGVSQRLASGVVINPTVSVSRLHDDVSNYTAPSTGNVALNVVVPLRKGAGSDVVTAPVTAAGWSLQASRNSYRHIQAQAVVRTANAYWNLVAARQSLELASLAESRAGELLANARKLARADEIPRADLLKYEVRRVAQESDRLSAALQLSQALQALSQAVNAPIESLAATPHGLDAFPKAEDARLALLDDPAAVAQLLAGSAERRADIRAAEQSLRAANTLADAARRNSGTQLDLGFSVGYSGMTEGRAGVSTLGALGQPARGANVGLTLSFTLPSGDFERRGLILQRDAAAGQAQTDLDALRLRAGSDARAQLDALRAAIAQLDKANTQRRLQTTIFENERRSYQAGLSTLLDLFTTESQLTAYQTGWVQAQRNFAQALVLFRFQTASLLARGTDELDGPESQLLQAGSLTTLPQDIHN